MDIQSALLSVAVAVVLGGFGGIAYLVKFYWDRRRWRRFERLVEAYRSNSLEELTDDEMQSLVAMKLVDAGFTPWQAKELLEVAVSVAKGRWAVEEHGGITKRAPRKEEDES